MNQQLWSGFTTAAFLLAGLSFPSISNAQQAQSQDDTPDTNVSLQRENSEQNQPVAAENLEQNLLTPSIPDPALTATNASPSAETDVVKVGEYQSQDASAAAAETIAQIQPHEMQGRSAATVYVRDIPVLTFLGTPSAEPIANSDVKVATPADSTSAAATSEAQSSDPTWRATAIAAQLNQLYRDRVDANAITVHWENDRYVIRVNGADLVEINSEAILPDTTRDRANDALQATNRLRRLLGNAPPLGEIEGRPAPEPEAQDNIVQRTIRGIASWYGPGFNGRRSASGEIFNQNALTAAHRSLPFGTQVRVTNLRTGQSVIVRINDRGPFSGRRIIDLSAAAARAVGMMQSGVAPVSLDVLETPVSDRRAR